MKGIAASQGIAIAKVYKLEQPTIEIDNVVLSVEEELTTVSYTHLTLPTKRIV